MQFQERHVRVDELDVGAKEGTLHADARERQRPLALQIPRVFGRDLVGERLDEGRKLRRQARPYSGTKKLGCADAAEKGVLALTEGRVWPDQPRVGGRSCQLGQACEP